MDRRHAGSRLSRAFRASRASLSPALSLILLAGCGAKKEADPDDEGVAARESVECTCVDVQKGALDRYVSLRGRIATRPGGDLPVASLVAGKIVEVRVEEGARIKKGAVIALVDDLAPRAAASEAAAGVARARAAKTEADATLERTKKLVAEGISSRADLEVAQSHADSAASDLAAEEAAQNLASGTLGRVELRSAFDGVITKVWRGAGALVDGTAATPIVEMAADGALEFVADATERDLDLIALGEKADVVLASSATAFLGDVISIPRGVDSKTGLGSVRVLLTPTPGPSGGIADAAPFDEVRIGAFGHGRIHAKGLLSTLSVPRAALRGAILDGGEVAICDHGKSAIRHITIGYRDADRVEVLSGLSPGERVAVGDVLGLGDGTSITETEPSAAPAVSGADKP
jgi:HlyD family secretion protein